MYLYLTLPTQSSWFLSDMRGPPAETSLGTSSCLYQRLRSPVCLEARSPDTVQLLSLLSVPRWWGQFPFNHLFLPVGRAPGLGILCDPNAHLRARTSPLPTFLPWHWPVEAGISLIWSDTRLSANINCHSYFWHPLLRPMSVLKRASHQKESLASLKPYLFQMFLKIWGGDMLMR